MSRFAVLGLAAAATLALAAVAHADQPSSSQPATSSAPPSTTTTGPAPTAKNDPMICEEEGEIGSRLGGRRVCHTKSEWKALGYNSQNELDATVRRSLANTPPGH
jgi:hypothetical protein